MSNATPLKAKARPATTSLRLRHVTGIGYSEFSVRFLKRRNAEPWNAGYVARRADRTIGLGLVAPGRAEPTMDKGALFGLRHLIERQLSAFRWWKGTIVPRVAVGEGHRRRERKRQYK
jgi:hypothetical protein